MSVLLRNLRLLASAAALAAFALAGCSANQQPVETAVAPSPALAPEIPASIRPEEVVGRWG